MRSLPGVQYCACCKSMINRMVSCSERLRLIVEYRNAVQDYAQAVTDFTDLLELQLNTELDVLRRRCRYFWQKAEDARLALARHEANHYCDRHESEFSTP